MRVLLVEDDPLVADAVCAGMRDSGMAVDRVESAEQADTALRTEHFDLIILDIGLPGMSGLEFLRRLRRGGRGVDERIPVLILTARDGLDDRVDGLDLGADDYMVKPFEFRELLARSRALIRRTGSSIAEATRLGELTLDASRREMKCGPRAIDLTPREWSIMEYLALHLETVVPKHKLLQAISGWDDSLAPNAVEVYVSRLRGKLDGTGVTIRTVRGVGYRLEGPHA
ncbi:MAG: response regulator transcription factor [Burkholderiaceae bacterium]|jgi:DNA-binding response OmpR family regulator